MHQVAGEAVLLACALGRSSLPLCGLYAAGVKTASWLISYYICAVLEVERPEVSSAQL